MKILFDARVIRPNAHHGIARHAAGLLTELIRRPDGFRLSVLARRPDDLAGLDLGATEIIACGLRPYSPAELLGLPRRLGRIKPDLYHSPTFMPPLGRGTPFTFTVHDLIHLDFGADYPLNRRLAWKFIIAPGLKRARRIITVGQHTADRLAARFGLAPDKIVVVGNGVDAAFSPRPAEAGRRAARGLGIEGRFVISLGNPRPHKNMGLLTAAFGRSAEAEAWPTLLVVGAGGLDLPHRPGRLVRADHLTDDQLAELYSAAEAAVFPSLAEGFGLPPLEAAACGCPILASDIPAHRQVLGPDGAIYFSPTEPDDLVRAWRELTVDSDRAAELGRAGLERAGHFTWQRAAEALKAAWSESSPAGGANHG